MKRKKDVLQVIVIVLSAFPVGVDISCMYTLWVKTFHLKLSSQIKVWPANNPKHKIPVKHGLPRAF